VPSAWKFRQEFQSRLGIVFDHLANIYHSFPGRITADTFKKQITSVVDIWEDWIVFSPDFTSELRMRLDGALNAQEGQPKEDSAENMQENIPSFSSRFKSSSFQPTFAASSVARNADGEPTSGKIDEDLDGEDDVDGKPLADDVDGEPLVDDVDGVPMDDVDGVPMDDIDGVPMDHIDSAPMDDVDGESLEEAEVLPFGDIVGKPSDNGTLASSTG
jgi:U2-associated protein SR140